MSNLFIWIFLVEGMRRLWNILKGGGTSYKRLVYKENKQIYRFGKIFRDSKVVSSNTVLDVKLHNPLGELCSAETWLMFSGCCM
jgi:hypothetical protein